MFKHASVLLFMICEVQVVILVYPQPLHLIQDIFQLNQLFQLFHAMLGGNCSFLSLGMSCMCTLEGKFLKKDEFVVTVRCVFWAFLVFYFLNSSDCKGVDILFCSCWGCFINTLSPTLRSVLLVWLHSESGPCFLSLPLSWHQFAPTYIF